MLVPTPILPAEAPVKAHRLLYAAAAATAITNFAAVRLSAQMQRPMTFLDVQNMRQTSGTDLSGDGKWMLYSLSTPDWNQARRQSDVWLVSVDKGLSSARQLTFAKDKN